MTRTHHGPANVRGRGLSKGGLWRWRDDATASAAQARQDRRALAAADLDGQAPAPAARRVTGCLDPCARCLGTVPLVLPVGYVAIPERDQWPPANAKPKRARPKVPATPRPPRLVVLDGYAGEVDSWAMDDADGYDEQTEVG
jgi:hypothetical protein